MDDPLLEGTTSSRKRQQKNSSPIDRAEGFFIFILSCYILSSCLSVSSYCHLNCLRIIVIIILSNGQFMSPILEGAQLHDVFPSSDGSRRATLGRSTSMELSRSSTGRRTSSNFSLESKQTCLHFQKINKSSLLLIKLFGNLKFKKRRTLIWRRKKIASILFEMKTIFHLN